MAYTNQVINQVTLPNGVTYDSNDLKAVHYLGLTTTDITSGSIASDKVSINGTDTPVSVGDTVLYGTSKNMYRCTAVTPADPEGDPTTTGASSWENISPTAAEIPIQAITVDGDATKVTVTNHVADITAINADLVAVVAEGESTDPDYATKVAQNTLANGVRAATQSANDGSTKIATTAYVDRAIDNLPEPMVFRGAINDGQYPVNAAVGDTYKITTADSDEGVTPAFKIGDTVVYSEPSTGTYEWVVIPSGDEPAGTVTEINVGTGLTASDDTTSEDSITTSGTISLNLGATTSVSDRTYAVTTDTDENLVVEVPASTIANSLTDADTATGVTNVTTSATASETTGDINLNPYSVSNGVLSIQYIVASTADDVVVNRIPTP